MTPEFFHGRNAILNKQILTDTEVEQAVSEPPKNTRAWFRREMLKRYGDQIQRIINMSDDMFGLQIILTATHSIVLKNPLFSTRKECEHIFADNPTLPTVLTRLQQFDTKRVEVRERERAAM